MTELPVAIRNLLIERVCKPFVLDRLQRFVFYLIRI